MKIHSDTMDKASFLEMAFYDKTYILTVGLLTYSNINFCVPTHSHTGTVHVLFASQLFVPLNTYWPAVIDKPEAI